MATKKITRAIANILADRVQIRFSNEQKKTAISKTDVEQQVKSSKEYLQFIRAVAAVEVAQDFANQKRDVVAELCEKLALQGPYNITINYNGSVGIYFKRLSREEICDQIILNSFVAQDGILVDDLVEDVYVNLSF